VGVRTLARRFAGALDDAAAAGADASSEGASGAACPLSFAPETPVATPTGEQAIGSLKVGDRVTAYDPSTGQTSAQMVQHVWINHDDDLLDVTLASSDSQQPLAVGIGATKQKEVAVVGHGLRASPSDTATNPGGNAPVTETIHTTAKHPWLTADRGWVKAGDLQLGERVVREDGSNATIVTLYDLPGAADYYNLTIGQLHTYAVGDGQYVVHNCGDGDGPVHQHFETREDAMQAAQDHADFSTSDAVKTQGRGRLGPQSRMPSRYPVEYYQARAAGDPWAQDAWGPEDPTYYEGSNGGQIKEDPFGHNDPRGPKRPVWHDYGHIHSIDPNGAEEIYSYGGPLDVTRNG
jgi:hypothetical protein